MPTQQANQHSFSNAEELFLKQSNCHEVKNSSLVLGLELTTSQFPARVIETA